MSWRERPEGGPASILTSPLSSLAPGNAAAGLASQPTSFKSYKSFPTTEDPDPVDLSHLSRAAVDGAHMLGGAGASASIGADGVPAPGTATSFQATAPPPIHTQPLLPQPASTPALQGLSGSRIFSRTPSMDRSNSRRGASLLGLTSTGGLGLHAHAAVPPSPGLDLASANSSTAGGGGGPQSPFWTSSRPATGTGIGAVTTAATSSPAHSAAANSALFPGASGHADSLLLASPMASPLTSPFPSFKLREARSYEPSALGIAGGTATPGTSSAANSGPLATLGPSAAAAAASLTVRAASERRIQRLLSKIDSVCSTHSNTSNWDSGSNSLGPFGPGAGASAGAGAAAGWASVRGIGAGAAERDESTAPPSSTGFLAADEYQTLLSMLPDQPDDGALRARRRSSEAGEGPRDRVRPAEPVPTAATAAASLASSVGVAGEVYTGDYGVQPRRVSPRASPAPAAAAAAAAAVLAAGSAASRSSVELASPVELTLRPLAGITADLEPLGGHGNGGGGVNRDGSMHAAAAAGAPPRLAASASRRSAFAVAVAAAGAAADAAADESDAQGQTAVTWPKDAAAGIVGAGAAATSGAVGLADTRARNTSGRALLRAGSWGSSSLSDAVEREPSARQLVRLSGGTASFSGVGVGSGGGSASARAMRLGPLASAALPSTALAVTQQAAAAALAAVADGWETGRASRGRGARGWRQREGAGGRVQGWTSRTGDRSSSSSGDGSSEGASGSAVEKEEEEEDYDGLRGRGTGGIRAGRSPVSASGGLGSGITADTAELAARRSGDGIGTDAAAGANRGRGVARASPLRAAMSDDGSSTSGGDGGRSRRRRRGLRDRVSPYAPLSPPGDLHSQRQHPERHHHRHRAGKAGTEEGPPEAPVGAVGLVDDDSRFLQPRPPPARPPRDSFSPPRGTDYPDAPAAAAAAAAGRSSGAAAIGAQLGGEDGGGSQGPVLQRRRSPLSPLVQARVALHTAAPSPSPSPAVHSQETAWMHPPLEPSPPPPHAADPDAPRHPHPDGGGSRRAYNMRSAGGAGGGDALLRTAGALLSDSEADDVSDSMFGTATIALRVVPGDPGDFSRVPTAQLPSPPPLPPPLPPQHPLAAGLTSPLAQQSLPQHLQHQQHHHHRHHQHHHHHHHAGGRRLSRHMSHNSGGSPAASASSSSTSLGLLDTSEAAAGASVGAAAAAVAPAGDMTAVAPASAESLIAYSADLSARINARLQHLPLQAAGPAAMLAASPASGGLGPTAVARLTSPPLVRPTGVPVAAGGGCGGGGSSSSSSALANAAAIVALIDQDLGRVARPRPSKPRVDEGAARDADGSDGGGSSGITSPVLTAAAAATAAAGSHSPVHPHPHPPPQPMPHAYGAPAPTWTGSAPPAGLAAASTQAPRQLAQAFNRTTTAPPWVPGTAAAAVAVAVIGAPPSPSAGSSPTGTDGGGGGVVRPQRRLRALSSLKETYSTARETLLASASFAAVTAENSGCSSGGGGGGGGGGGSLPGQRGVFGAHRRLSIQDHRRSTSSTNSLHYSWRRHRLTGEPSDGDGSSGDVNSDDDDDDDLPAAARALRRHSLLQPHPPAMASPTGAPQTGPSGATSPHDGVTVATTTTTTWGSFSSHRGSAAAAAMAAATAAAAGGYLGPVDEDVAGEEERTSPARPVNPLGTMASAGRSLATSPLVGQQQAQEPSPPQLSTQQEQQAHLQMSKLQQQLAQEHLRSGERRQQEQQPAAQQPSQPQQQHSTQQPLQQQQQHQQQQQQQQQQQSSLALQHRLRSLGGAAGGFGSIMRRLDDQLEMAAATTTTVVARRQGGGQASASPGGTTTTAAADASLGAAAATEALDVLPLSAALLAAAAAPDGGTICTPERERELAAAAVAPASAAPVPRLARTTSKLQGTLPAGGDRHASLGGHAVASSSTPHPLAPQQHLPSGRALSVGGSPAAAPLASRDGLSLARAASTTGTLGMSSPSGGAVLAAVGGAADLGPAVGGSRTGGVPLTAAAAPLPPGSVGGATTPSVSQLVSGQVVVGDDGTAVRVDEIKRELERLLAL